MSRIIHSAQKIVRPFPGLWMPGMPVPGTMGFGQGWPCPNCCGGEPCSCSNCESSNAPCCLKIVISGIAEDGCGECDCLNGTFLVRGNSCNPTGISIPFLCGSGGVINLEIVKEGGDHKIRVILGDHVWVKNYGGPRVDCLNLVNESIPHATSAEDCDSTGSTCLVTALDLALGVCTNNICTEAEGGEPVCICDQVPPQVIATVSGIHSGECPNCAFLDGEYILDNSGGCIYEHFFSPTVCTYFKIRVQFLRNASSHIIIASISSTSAGSMFWQSGTLTSPFDCTATDVTLPSSTRSLLCIEDDGSTIRVEALYA